LQLIKFLGWLGVLSLSLLQPNPAAGAPDAAAGKTKFQKSICVQCHGLEAQGMAGMGMDLRSAPLIRAGKAEAIDKFIENGHRGTNQYPGGMPPNGGISLSASDRANITAWLLTLAKPPKHP
jgi:mono/diheme cytochrome c family protein